MISYEKYFLFEKLFQRIYVFRIYCDVYIIYDYIIVKLKLKISYNMY